MLSFFLSLVDISTNKVYSKGATFIDVDRYLCYLLPPSHTNVCKPDVRSPFKKLLLLSRADLKCSFVTNNQLIPREAGPSKVYYVVACITPQCTALLYSLSRYTSICLLNGNYDVILSHRHMSTFPYKRLNRQSIFYHFSRPNPSSIPPTHSHLNHNGVDCNSFKCPRVNITTLPTISYHLPLFSEL